MGAIAVWRTEERQIEKLRKELKIPTKSGLIRAALQTLARQTEDARRRREVQESVRRCAEADRQENRELRVGLQRLMTNDPIQAGGARALGFEVLRPGHR